MRASTECRVDELIDRSRQDMLKRFLSAEGFDAAVNKVVTGICESLAGQPRAQRVAVCVCALEVQLEMYADEVDGEKHN